MTGSDPGWRPAGDAALAVALLAVDPAGLGGLVVRGAVGPAAQGLLDDLRRLLPADAPSRRMPVQIADARLLGGLDLAATMQAGRPVFERGLLVDAHGGVVVVPMAERLPPSTAARLASVMDGGEVVVERDGFASRHPACIAVVAFDESTSPEERPPQGLLDRLALSVDSATSPNSSAPPWHLNRELVTAARERLSRIAADDNVTNVLCRVAAAVGIVSLRAPSLALKAARAHAALCGRAGLNDDDVSVAARLVLAPRATVLPASPDQPDQPEPPPDQNDQTESDERKSKAPDELDDVVLEAVRAAIPPGLLAQLSAARTETRRGAPPGRTGVQRHALRRGRPAGVRRGDLRAGARLNVVETLRAAAPWQAVRRRERGGTGGCVQVRRDDFRLNRFKQRTESATIFVVDASGSSALHRLAEAKGAIELLLADCYVRRDQVAMIAFRGRTAELLLPPTRSLTRAKRCLSALPGGGGTPVAGALDAAALLADGLRRKGLTPAVVLLTDGRANVARDGTAGRECGEADALAAARAYRALGVMSLLVDTSPSPGSMAGRLASEMGARYLALPRADAVAISRAVTGASPVRAAR